MTAEFDQTSPADIERYGKRLVPKTLRSQKGVISIPEKYLETEVGKQTKGTFGMLLEKYYYGINPGNDSAPDFPEAGVELKSTPLKKLSRGGYSAKERLVLGLINFQTEALISEFRSSSFFKKNAKIMLISYEHQDGRAVVDHPVRIAKLLEFDKLPAADQIIIRNDWEKIMEKVRSNRAHELSEGDTDYLGACTKAGLASDTRLQIGGTPAKPRAYSFKAGYMSVLLRQMLEPEKTAEEFENAVQVEDLTDKSFEEEILARFERFKGKSIAEILSEVGDGLNLSSKDFSAMLARRMIGVRGRKIEEFEKAEIQMKTIQLGRNGTPAQHMSFPAMHFSQLLTENWEAADEDEEENAIPSTFKSQLQRRFLFVVYQCENDCRKGDNRTFVKAFFWTMPLETLETEVRNVWEKMAHAVENSDIRAFPKSSQSTVAHVRPHGIKGRDVDLLPDGTKTTKRCFWLNKAFIKAVIDSNGLRSS